MAFTVWMAKIKEILKKPGNALAGLQSKVLRCAVEFRKFISALKGNKAAQGKKEITGNTGSFGSSFKKTIDRGIVHEISAWARKGLESLSEWKKHPLFLGLAGIAVLALFLLVIILALNSGNRNKNMLQTSASLPSIASEELFIPSEPDFLPGILLEREPRYFWSLDDIRVYWRIPEDPGRWRKEISLALDELMEGVP